MLSSVRALDTGETIVNATSTSTPDERSRRRRVVWATLTLAIALATIAVSATGAIFTETDAVGENIFTTGTVSLGQNPATAIVAAGGMAPGDAATGRVEVTNTGSLELRYAVTSTTNNDTLAGQLDLWVWDEAAEADSTGDNDTCDATPGKGVGDYLYTQGVLGSTGSTGGTNVIGDPAVGGQAGDRVLGATDSEVLCFHVALPTDTGNTFQNRSTTATFTFEAEQTVNN